MTTQRALFKISVVMLIGFTVWHTRRISPLFFLLLIAWGGGVDD